MKRLLLLLLCLSAPLLACGQQTPATALGVESSLDPRKPVWSVRLEMLMVELPQDKALALLPDLNDDAKIDAACDRIMAAVGRKEATLIGCPVVRSMSGEKTTVETIDEIVYPTQFQAPPQPPQTLTVTSSDAVLDALNISACPTSFEKRNAGVTIEYEAVVEHDGKWINVSIQPQHVVLQGYEQFEVGKTVRIDADLRQPKFFTTKVSTGLLVRNGQRVLLGVHQLKAPENRIELDVLKVSATLVGD